VGATLCFYPEAYRTHGVHIEHGQQHEELARMDMKRPFLTAGLPEPVLNLPWGSLFVAVVLSQIKMERPHVDKVRPVPQFLRYILLHDTFWAVGALVRLGWFFWVTVVFRSRYHLRSGFRASWRMFRELTVYPDFDGVAEKLLRSDPSIHTVILGHTHVLRDRKFEGGGRYLNEGSWNEATHLDLNAFGTRVQLTYAQILSSEARTEVRLKRWMGHWRPEADLVL
jgi:UDP-2,3-diacylglucosamine pyrophosphatase LpxH